MNSTTLFRRFYVIFVIGITLYSCVKDNLFNEQDSTSSSKPKDIPFGETLILGKQLENPFSIENMTKALNAVKGSQRNTSNRLAQITIKPTTLTEETRTILGYNCKKTLYDMNGREIEVWYTTDFPLKQYDIFRS